MPPLPPWIRSIKRPLDRLVSAPRSFEDLPDTEPGEELGTGAPRRPRLRDLDPAELPELPELDALANAPTEPPENAPAATASPPPGPPARE
jgi:hypothetical protein